MRRFFYLIILSKKSIFGVHAGNEFAVFAENVEHLWAKRAPNIKNIKIALRKKNGGCKTPPKFFIKSVKINDEINQI